MTSAQWVNLALGAIFGWYIAPGLAALRDWMCVKRDVLRNAAKRAKRERT